MQLQKTKLVSYLSSLGGIKEFRQTRSSDQSVCFVFSLLLKEPTIMIDKTEHVATMLFNYRVPNIYRKSYFKKRIITYCSQCHFYIDRVYSRSKYYFRSNTPMENRQSFCASIERSKHHLKKIPNSRSGFFNYLFNFDGFLRGRWRYRISLVKLKLHLIFVIQINSDAPTAHQLTEQ
jgi:hypothetical protein